MNDRTAGSRRFHGIVAALAVLCATSAGAADFCDKGGLGSVGARVVAQGEPGLPPAPDPIGGVGGTGIVASLKPGEEASVIGTLTRFGSVCVNGEHVRYAPDVPTDIDGQAGTARDLQLGQVILLRVVRDDDGDLSARRIAVVDAVVGPVTERDEAAQRFAVMGRWLRLGDDTMFGNAGSAVPELGVSVGVSGIAAPDGTLVATRVQAAWRGERAYVSGVVTELDGRMFDVEGVPVQVAGTGPLPDLERGVEVAVSGLWNGDRLEAESLVLNPLIDAAKSAPAVVSLEGFLDRCGDTGRPAIGGVAVRMPPEVRADEWIGRRVIAVGRPGDGDELVLTSVRTSPLDRAEAARPAATGRPVRACGPLHVLPR
jgi:hypothetical protein